MAITITLIAMATFLFLFHTLRRKTSNLPPSPPALPFVGNLHQLGSLLHRSLASLSENYGPLILLHLGSIPVAVVSSAEMAEEVLKTQDIIFSTRPPSSIAARLAYGPRDMAFAPYGPHWRQMRKICILHILSNKRVQEFARLRKEEVELLVANIAGSSPAPVNLSNMLVTLSSDVICRAALGRKCSGEQRFSEMLRELSALFCSFPLRDFIPWLGWIDELSGLNARIKRNSEEFDQFLEQILEEHIDRRRGSAAESHPCVDFIDVLLSLKEENNEEAAITLERSDLKGLILDIFAAGTDTSAATMQWVMAELLSHPNSMRKVQEEIRQTVGSNSTVMVKEEDIDQMKYFKAAIKETLRMHPSLPLLIPRMAMKDAMLRGYSIPAGTWVLVNVWKIARDPKYWENADEFQPERFLINNISTIDYSGQDFQYLPFSSGRRSCPGFNFGLATVHHALANLLYRFDWDFAEGEKEHALDMKETPGLSISKKYDLIVSAKPYGFFEHNE
ncbi:Cytochrome P450 71A1 [Apostasia shenzhenica]|uniref:Cytochrome P450 71A1 n=1 Tax=Apostasia shenzhenica TaxID=1088818 RepID=A0A2I0AUC5_9ASPA|nr:Cytochrome P450 71A1 [Apostasia shenzhenica]